MVAVESEIKCTILAKTFEIECNLSWSDENELQIYFFVNTHQEIFKFILNNHIFCDILNQVTWCGSNTL